MSAVGVGMPSGVTVVFSVCCVTGRTRRLSGSEGFVAIRGASVGIVHLCLGSGVTLSLPVFVEGI